MTDRVPSPETTKPDGRRKKNQRATESVVRIPLWNEVLELETTLAPAAAAHVKATNKPMPWLAISIGLTVAVILITMASVEFYRQQLIVMIMARPPILRGRIPTFLEFQTLSSIANTWEVTWQATGQALASGAGAWLLLVAGSRTRRFAKRVPWIPVLVGAAIYFAIMWYVVFIYPLR
jgi:hypothetical protein